MPCSVCGNEKVAARKLCSGCYHRLRRNGSVARKNIQNQGKKCAIRDCGNDAHSKGLCHVHYDRQIHPLRQTWKNIRSRHPGETPERWNEFEPFLADVGERPSTGHQLRRIDESLPYGPENVRWLKSIAKKKDCYSKEERSVYAKNWHLRSKYGLSREAFDDLLKAQGGHCAICDNPAEMHVDHCHSTGDVRGLLCVSCNRGLGYFRDNPEYLKRAAAYLARSQQ